MEKTDAAAGSLYFIEGIPEKGVLDSANIPFYVDKTVLSADLRGCRGK